MGTFEHSLDPKGRVILPRKIRDELGKGMVITRGLEDCLYVFPQAEFDLIAERLRRLPLTQAPARQFTRVLLSGASQESPDAQGRILIPPHLREHAHLSKDVVVVGNLNRVELWDREAWERWLSPAQAAFNDEANAAVLSELGI